FSYTLLGRFGSLRFPGERNEPTCHLVTLSPCHLVTSATPRASGSAGPASQAKRGLFAWVPACVGYNGGHRKETTPLSGGPGPSVAHSAARKEMPDATVAEPMPPPGGHHRTRGRPRARPGHPAGEEEARSRRGPDGRVR